MRRPFAIAILFAVVTLPICATSQSLSDRDFLELASKRVREYTDLFHDLVVNETTTVELLESKGRPQLKRSLISSLIIYRSQVDAKHAAEYRDVESVDGKELNSHEQRAAKLFERLSKATSVADELQKITDESSRYNEHVKIRNMTLREGLP